MNAIHLVPAYGRDYTNRKALRADLDVGKDFVIADISNPWDGKPVNLPQLVERGYTDAFVRYRNLRRQARIELKGGKAC